MNKGELIKTLVKSVVRETRGQVPADKAADTYQRLVAHTATLEAQETDPLKKQIFAALRDEWEAETGFRTSPLVKMLKAAGEITDDDPFGGNDYTDAQAGVPRQFAMPRGGAATDADQYFTPSELMAAGIGGPAGQSLKIPKGSKCGSLDRLCGGRGPAK